MYSLHKYLTTVALRRFLDDIGAGELVGGNVLDDEVGEIEVVCAVAGIYIAIAGGGEANVAAVVGIEGVPERIVDPFVTRAAVVHVGDFRLLVERNAGLASVCLGLVSSAADGKGLVDGEALEFGSFEPCIHEGSPGCAAVHAKDKLAELMDGDGGFAYFATAVVVEGVLVVGIHLAGLVLAVLPLDGRQLLLAEEVFAAVTEGDPSHPLLIGMLIACSNAGRSLDEAVYAQVDEIVEVSAAGAEREVAIVTIVLLLVPDASGVQALPRDL